MVMGRWGVTNGGSDEFRVGRVVLLFLPLGECCALSLRESVGGEGGSPLRLRMTSRHFRRAMAAHPLGDPADVTEGAKVSVADRNAAAAAERVATALGANARSVHADVTRPADVATMLDAAQAHFGGLHILVNNAGIGHVPQPMEELAEDEFDRILAVNVKAIYLATRAVVPRFKQQTSGVILNLASTAGVSPRPRLTWYNASKGWVITATRSMAVELAPFGIRVNALNPGGALG